MYKNGKNITFTDRNNDCVNNFLRSISKSKPLTNEEEYELWNRMQQGSLQARDQLIYANLRYVVTIAKNYQKSGTAFEDLLMAGCEGITKAADKFNAALGFRFISFATWYIENEIRKTAYDNIRHSTISLDETLRANDDDQTTRAELLSAEQQENPDGGLRYNDTLVHLAARVDKRLCGAGKLIADLHQMLQKGYTSSDFARNHHLTDQQMHRFLNILREEAANSFRHSA